eukprot:gene47089-60902_t
MLRYRATQAQKHGVKFADNQLAQTDRNGKIATLLSSVANWATQRDNELTRPLLAKVADLDPAAELPRYAKHSLEHVAKATTPEVNVKAPAFGRKAVIYATCFGNYNDTSVGEAARAVLALNGVSTEVVHPHCCGMPMLEQGLIGEVAKSAEVVAKAFKPYIEQGYDIIAL